MKRVLAFLFLSACLACGQTPTPPGSYTVKVDSNGNILHGILVHTPNNPDGSINFGAGLLFVNGVEVTGGGGGGGAPVNATYITQTANATLTNEFPLGSLLTGILKNTTTTGVPSIAVAGTDYVAPNAAITGATNTKITYDAKGLVTSGTAATTADIADSSNKRYVTDAQLVVIGNTSGTNTGDQTITLTGDVTGTGTGSFATTIASNAVTTAKILNANVTLAKLQNVSANSVIGNDSVLGPPTVIVGTTDQVLRIGSGGGGVIGFGQIATGGITNSAVTLAKIQNIGTSRLLGRTTASSGIIEELTVGSGLTLAAGSLSADFTTAVPATRTITTTSPLNGGGDLSANRTLTIDNAQANGTNKGAASFTAADFNDTTGNISLDYTNGQAASGSTKGFLTAADWTTFNGKQTQDADLDELAGAPWEDKIIYRISEGVWDDVRVAGGIRFENGILYEIDVASQIEPTLPTIASAGTIDVTGVAADKSRIDVTGTTGPITEITIEEGREVLLRFPDGVGLTHSANLLLPGGQDIPVTVGAWGKFYGGPSDVVICTFFSNADNYSTHTFNNIFMNPEANVGYADESGPWFTIGKPKEDQIEGGYLRFVNGGHLGIVPQSGTGNTAFLDITALTSQRLFAFPDHPGTFATQAGTETLTNKTINASQLVDASVSLAKMADMATASVIYRKTAGTGVPEVQSLATLKTDLGLTGTNSGDQTIKTILGCGGISWHDAAAGDLYLSPTSPPLDVFGVQPEADMVFVMPFAGTLKNLNVRTGSTNAATNSPTTVITARKNGADTALTVTMNQALSTTTTDSTNTVSYAAGDRLTIKIVTTGASATSAQIASITMEYDN